CLIGSIESLLSFALPSLAPMRVMCIAGFGLAAAGHLVSWYLSPKVCAKRRVMLMCRKIGLHRYRQCRRASWSPHRLCHAVDLVEYQIHMSHVNAYFHSLHEMHHLRGGGGGGGAHVTKRKRNQKELLLGLKELLEKFTEPNEKVSPKKSKKSDTLLDALQKTVTRAQQNPRNLLQSLTQLVQLANDGKIRIDDPALASGPNKQPKPAAPKSIPKQQNPKPTWADKVKSGTPPNESAPAMRLWTPPDTRESIAAVIQIHTDPCRDPPGDNSLCFCRHSWRHCQSKPANIISGMLRDYDLQQNFITSYGWRTLQSQQWTGYAEAVTGFLKIDRSNLDSILKISGKHGVFIEHLAQNRPSDNIQWIPQEKDETDMDYFARVTSDDHANGFTYRRQGRSRLGLRMPEGTAPTNANKAKVWEARGVPGQWSTGVLTAWLNKQKCQDISLMSQPTKQRGWLFRASHPTNSFCFAYENATGENICISRFFHRVKTPKQTPIRAAGKSMGHANFWHSLNGDKGVSKPKNAIVINDSNQNDESMPEAPPHENKPDTAGTEIKRPAPQGSSPEKKRAHVQKTDLDNSEINFQGYEFADAGGNGDCGYRALSVAYAIQDGRGIDDALTAAKPMGATLRAQITSHISKYDHFKEFFAVDPRWTVELEGGPIPTTYSEWVEATARPNRWIDGPCLSTAATKLRRNIAIWKWEKDQWVKQTVITPLPSHQQNMEDATKYPPLPLFLKDGHYRTLKPGLAHRIPSGMLATTEVEDLHHPAGPNREAVSSRWSSNRCIDYAAHLPKGQKGVRAHDSFLQRKISHKEDERINQAVVLIRRATWLPVSFAMRKQIIAAAPLSKDRRETLSLLQFCNCRAFPYQWGLRPQTNSVEVRLTLEVQRLMAYDMLIAGEAQRNPRPWK
ncbi:unnamed protein product, partial [Cladocopium goreaui]